jgi:hypothetical protein
MTARRCRRSVSEGRATGVGAGVGRGLAVGDAVGAGVGRGLAVGAGVGVGVGCDVGDAVGPGLELGFADGCDVGAGVGAGLGLGFAVGVGDGDGFVVADGAAVGAPDEAAVGAPDEAAVGAPDDAALAVAAVPARDTGTPPAKAATPMTIASVDVRRRTREGCITVDVLDVPRPPGLARRRAGSYSGGGGSVHRPMGPCRGGPSDHGGFAAGAQRRTIRCVSDLLPTLMTFPNLDQAESALDWIGVEFADGDGCFEGTLGTGDAELLDAALADPETPEPVRALAAALRKLLTAAGDADADEDALDVGWRVAFTI